MKKRIKILNKLLTCTILSLIITLFTGQEQIFLVLLLSFTGLLMLCFLVEWSNRFSVHLLPKEKHRFKHIFLIVPINFILVYGFMLAFMHLLNRLHIGKNMETIHQLALPISVIASLLTTTLFEGADFINQWKRYIVRSEQIEKANLVAKYETLKKQIHPHFLFNGLNTLIGLIDQHDPNASVYAQNLSEFLKYLLSHQSKELISFAEELKTVQQYMFVQQVRFNHNIHFTVHCNPGHNNKKIPPLSLQMLVENAIKHNIASAAKPLRIYIECTADNFVKVENNIQRKIYTESAGVGLNNIKERYKFISEQQPEIRDNNETFSVKLPLID